VYARGMNRADALQRITELREEIHRHDYLYYTEARPESSDAEYDAVMRELRGLESEFPDLVAPDSPTQRVAGQPVDAFRPVEHRAAMLSLDNATSPDDLREFAARIGRAASAFQVAGAVQRMPAADSAITLAADTASTATTRRMRME